MNPHKIVGSLSDAELSGCVREALAWRKSGVLTGPALEGLAKRLAEEAGREHIETTRLADTLVVEEAATRFCRQSTQRGSPTGRLTRSEPATQYLNSVGPKSRAPDDTPKSARLTGDFSALEARVLQHGFTGYGEFNPLLNEFEDLKESARLRSNDLARDEISRAAAKATAEAYAYCQHRLMWFNR